MILATVITNLVMAVMIREANVTLDSDGDFRVSSVKTQFIHSVTLHEINTNVLFNVINSNYIKKEDVWL